MSDNTIKKDEILFHIEQIKLDPSYINSFENPAIFDAVSEALMSGDIREKVINKRSNKQSNNNGQNDLYNQHFNKLDSTTKQHNPQYKNQRSDN